MKYALVIVMVVCCSFVAADTCFTVLNSPTNDRHYFKAVTYNDITAGVSGWLSSSNGIYANPGLGPGYQYNIRVDNNCFDGYLLTTLDNSGIDSGTIFIQKYYGDYFTTGIPGNSIYTISRSAQDTQSVRYVKDIASGDVGGYNYLQMPTFTSANYDALKEGVCNPNFKITDQLYKIMDKVWSELTFSETTLECSGYDNIVDCVAGNGRGSSVHYATIVALLARDCGVPTRVVHGISEGSFDGIDVKFDEGKMHYWIEFFDTTWYTLDVTEESSTGPSDIEIDCLDGEDNDDDELPDCRDDDCSHVTFCQGAYPTTTQFDNALSTDIDSLTNAYKITELRLENNYGTLVWSNQSMDLRNQNLDQAVQITSNKIVLNTFIPELNVPAVAELKLISWDDPVILKSGQTCSNCEILSYQNSKLIFKIPGAGIYIAKASEQLSVAETQESILASNSTTPDNQSYLPPIPTAKVTKYDSWTSIGDKIKSLKDRFTDLTNVGKFIVVAIAGVVIYGLYSWRRRQKYGYG